VIWPVVYRPTLAFDVAVLLGGSCLVGSSYLLLDKIFGEQIKSCL